MYLAAVGPKNLELAGELTDGWLAIFFAPELRRRAAQATLRAGRAKAGRTLDGFDICPTVPVVIGDDRERCAEPVRAYAALYVGGMGSREQNFYNALAVRMGFGEAAREVQDLYLASGTATPRPRCRSSSSTRPRCSGPGPGRRPAAGAGRRRA